MSIQTDIKNQLEIKGVDFIYFVNISQLSEAQNKKFPSAILFGIVLPPAYIKKVNQTPRYVEKIKQSGQIKSDAFHLNELKTDRIADELCDFISDKGYKAYSQSERNIEASGFYNNSNLSTPLPHKTIALMANMGWIGKHNLLVTPKYGSAISMCSVLTNSPMKTKVHKPSVSQCGKCRICVDICRPGAITGNNWKIEKHRENVIDIHKCTTCFECVVHCPYTKKYMQQGV